MDYLTQTEKVMALTSALSVLLDTNLYPKEASEVAAILVDACKKLATT